MSAPTPRNRGGSSIPKAPRGAPYNRGGSRERGNNSLRGQTRGGRGGSTTAPPAGPHGLLQQMRAGAVGRGASNGGAGAVRGFGASRASSTTASRGRGQGHYSKTFNNASREGSPSNSQASSPFAAGDRSDTGDVQQRYNVLKNLREEERKEAIRTGFLADPEKKTTLDNAITPVGTCTVMCPPFERVERIVQNMVDRSERVADSSGGKPVPSEELMVKRFRRSAAGDDEQVPSDIRTPETLRKTLNYLVDKLVGGPERLAVVHKFVWDRTRAIRNDFSIQQVSKLQDVQIAVECFERIARFHIVALHQLSNPENLHEGENFDVFQEREQLNNTLLSLLYYYDDHRAQILFPNEAEFRAYHVILAFQSQHPDIEDRVQSWPLTLLADGRIQAALRLYQAAGSTLFDQGPLRPMTPFPTAQNDSGRFWTIMASGAVGYTLACVAELYFNQVRFGALNALWLSCKAAPLAQQAKFRDWTIQVITEYLGFDELGQTVDFCANFGLKFSKDEHDVVYLDIAARKETYLDQSNIPKEIVFSHFFVESKRCRRALTAVINNMKPADAIRQGLVDEGENDAQQSEVEDDGQSLFLPEKQPAPKTFGSGMFNPAASAFNPSSAFGSGSLPSNSIFGQQAPSSASNPAASTTHFAGFGQHAAGRGLSQSPPPSTSFGSHLAKPKSQSSPFSSKFGEATQSNGQHPSAGFNSPPLWGSEPAQVLNPPPPRSFSTFGQSRPSIEDNNPFGPNPTGKYAVAGTTPSQAAPPPTTSATTPSLPAPGFAFNSFGAPAPAQPVEPASTSGFASLNPATSIPTQPPPASSGFQFAKPDPPRSVTTSTAPFTPAPSSDSQQGPTTFSFAPQPTDNLEPALPSGPVQQSASPFALPKDIGFEFPNAEPQQKPAPIFQQPTVSSDQKPAFSFTSQPPAAAAAAPASSSSRTGASSSQQPISAATVPPATAPEPTLFSFTPAPSESAERPAPQAHNPLFNSKPGSASSPTQKDFASSQRSPKPKPATNKLFESQQHSSSNTKSTTPPLSPAQITSPSKPVVNKSELVNHAARLALTQSHGLLQQFLEYTLPAVLQHQIRDHQEEVREANLARLKHAYLSRKYGSIWRSTTWRNNLNKRAAKRRQIFSQSLRMEAEKKQQQEDELKDILAAVEESKRLKARAQQQNATAPKTSTSKKVEPVQLAGNKRKSLGELTNGDSPSIASAKSSQYHHKRSRTIGSMLAPPPPVAPTSSPGQFRHSIFSGRSSLGRSNSSSSLRKSDIRLKQDETKSDYFRLLASGADPDTPLIPLTARQVEAKRRRDKEEREAAIARAYNRRRVGLAPNQQSSPRATPSSPALSAASPQASTTSSLYNPEADELLQQLREARETLANESKWFQEETAKMTKEVEEQEKFRSSNSSSESPVTLQHSHHVASPAFSKSMSRVDQILQRAGTRSLLYHPRPESGYVPVPMSNRSAQRYIQSEGVEEIETNGTAKKRRKHGAIDHTYRPSKDELEKDEEDMGVSPQKRKKHAMPAVPVEAPVVSAQYLHSSNKFAQPQEPTHDPRADLTEEELLEDDEGQDEDQPEAFGHYFDQNGDADQEHSEEDLFEDDDYDEEEYDEEDEDAEHGGAVQYPDTEKLSQGFYEDTETPDTQATSRATSSGPGATVDDAIALSDSE